AVVNASLADPKLTTVVALAAVVSGPSGQDFHGLRPRRAVLDVGGTADTTVRFDLFAAPFFAALPAPAFLLTLARGTHSGFTDEDRGLTPAALARQQALTRRYTTAVLRRYLARDRRFERFLTTGDATRQGSDVALSARR